MINFNNILFVAPNFKKRKGGIASVLNIYAKNIKTFHFFSSAFYQNVRLNFLLFPINIIGLIGYLIIRRNIKVVHIHGASRGSFYRKYVLFLVAKKLFSKSVIYHVHGAEYHIFYKEASSFVKKRIKKMIKEVDKLIVLSDEWKRYFSQTFNVNHISVLNNVIDAQKERTNTVKGPLNILFLGKIGDRKGIFDVLEAVSSNKEIFQGKIKITIGGNGSIKKLKNYIEVHKLESIVKFVGWVLDSQKKVLLDDANVMILTSYNEGLPISLLEGMSYSLPIISTHVGGIPQILTHKSNGFVVEPGHINQIIEALKFYIDNPIDLVQHSKNSYNKSKEFFPNEVLKTLNEINSKLIRINTNE
ncbi:MAG: glycosyltransferase family 4 protein [Flavobacteriaceae bacterium]|nr:glycosyltransferase family 4 protein [Flavobacteriaceae bacterium]